MLDLLELEWQMLVSHHVGAGNQTVFPVRAVSALNHGSISPAQLFLSSLNFIVFYYHFSIILHTDHSSFSLLSSHAPNSLS